MQYNCSWKVFSQSFFTEIEINYNSSLRDVFDDIVTKYEKLPQTQCHLVNCKISVSAHTPTYDYVSVFFFCERVIRNWFLPKQKPIFKCIVF